MEEYIRELREISARRREAQREENEFCAPLLDTSQAEWLHGRVSDRDTFLLLAIRLFSPQCFIGRRMSKSIRVVLGRILGIGKTYVSKQIRIVIFRYENMPAFRRQVDECYKSTLHAIGVEKVTKRQIKF